VYLPKSLWPTIQEQVQAGVAEMKLGDVRSFDTFLGAVIDERAFRKHEAYLALGRETGETITGGHADGTKGWFVEPTLFRVDDPRHRLMQEEIFGPICTAFVYDDADFEETIDLVDTTSPYALTGAIFATDRRVIDHASERLRFAAGNFYVNDKPTGAVVGQQPFGGGRASGTNDKAGAAINLLRWTNPRAIKENFVPPRDWRYPFLG
jgi:1-pyrroline-5-carboxylate dehydrogenase